MKRVSWHCFSFGIAIFLTQNSSASSVPVSVQVDETTLYSLPLLKLRTDRWYSVRLVLNSPEEGSLNSEIDLPFSQGAFEIMGNLPQLISRAKKISIKYRLRESRPFTNKEGLNECFWNSNRDFDVVCTVYKQTALYGKLIVQKRLQTQTSALHAGFPYCEDVFGQGDREEYLAAFDRLNNISFRDDGWRSGCFKAFAQVLTYNAKNHRKEWEPIDRLPIGSRVLSTSSLFFQDENLRMPCWDIVEGKSSAHLQDGDTFQHLEYFSDRENPEVRTLEMTSDHPFLRSKFRLDSSDWQPSSALEVGNLLWTISNQFTTEIQTREPVDLVSDEPVDFYNLTSKYTRGYYVAGKSLQNNEEASIEDLVFVHNLYLKML